MAYEYSDLISNIEDWAGQAVDKGWLDKQAVLELLDNKLVSANTLFLEKNARPLVVAFMGGTGVGKSSLLNRLAGQSIAKTGVVRPTSREVTLYHHQSVSIHQLEEKFPLQQIQVAQHTEESNKKVIWIDMPDFDSTEEKNKDIVMQWLPYVDVLIYVVSPERYRDNKAWQLLLTEGASHAWLFVMNQWDRGDSSQYSDFEKQLAKAGFDDPVIYKTICTETAFGDDEFSQLQEMIETIATEKTVEQLELLGMQQQKNNLLEKLLQCKQLLGDEQFFSELAKNQASSWSETEMVLKQGFDWPLKQTSLVYSKSKLTLKKEKIKLWDDWAQSRLNDYLDDLILSADQKGFPSIPFRNGMVEIRRSAEKIIHTQTELGCRQSLIHPGNVMQRTFLKLVNVCELILPLAAMGVVGFQVFYGYYDSAMTDEEFLGADFAIHSLLLILISWLVPFFINKKMQPSLEKAALKGLYKGLQAAMTRIDLDVKQVIHDQQEQHTEIRMPLDRYIKVCEEYDASKNAGLKSEHLTRMLNYSYQQN